MPRGRKQTETLSPERARAFLGLVRSGAALEAALDASLKARHGISLRGYELLLHLTHFAPAGQLRVGQLSDQTPLSQSRTSRLVAELETAGLVGRSAYDGDSRSVAVAITQAGKAKLAEAQPTHHADLEAHLFSRLDRAEIAELGRLTAKVLGTDPLGPMGASG